MFNASVDNNTFLRPLQEGTQTQSAPSCNKALSCVSEKITALSTSLQDLQHPQIKDHEAYNLQILFRLLQVPFHSLDNLNYPRDMKKKLLIEKIFSKTRGSCEEKKSLLNQVSECFLKCPLFFNAVLAIRGNLELMEEANLHECKDLKAVVKQQLANLWVLSDLIGQVGGRDLLNVVFIDVQGNDDIHKKASEFFKPCFEGKEDLSKNEQDALELLKTIQKRQMLSDADKPAIAHQAIRQRAHLHRCTRESKAWVERECIYEEELEGGVFKLKSPSGPTVAFFKPAEGGSTANAIIEKLVYDFAEVMGLSDQFVPTEQTKLLVGEDGNDYQAAPVGGRHVFDWHQGTFIKTDKKDFSGGIQIAQGYVLEDAEKKASKNKQVDGRKFEIEKSAFSKAFLVSILFGMYDAHARNVLVIEEGLYQTAAGEQFPAMLDFKGRVTDLHGELILEAGDFIPGVRKLVFFDNAMSLPHSNGFVDCGPYIISAYDCCLIALGQAHEPLQPTDLEYLKDVIAGFESKVEQLRDYINNPFSKAGKLINKLPPYWFDSQKVVSAMQERVALMKEALKANQIHTLADLAAKANPGYRFSIMLRFLDKLNLNPSKSENHPYDVCFLEIEKVIDKAVSAGFDVKKIWDWSNDPSLQLTDLKKKVLDYIKEKETANPQFIKANAEEVLKIIKNAAHLDFKDWPLPACIKFCNLKSLKKLGIDWLDRTDEDWKTGFANTIAQFNYQEKQPIVIVDHFYGKDCGEKTLSLIYNTPKGPCQTPIKIHQQQGKIFVDNKEISLDEFASLYKAGGSIP